VIISAAILGLAFLSRFIVYLYHPITSLYTDEFTFQVLCVGRSPVGVVGVLTRSQCVLCARMYPVRSAASRVRALAAADWTFQKVCGWRRAYLKVVGFESYL